MNAASSATATAPRATICHEPQAYVLPAQVAAMMTAEIAPVRNVMPHQSTVTFPCRLAAGTRSRIQHQATQIRPMGTLT